jgi:hypothetical protein
MAACGAWVHRSSVRRFAFLLACAGVAAFAAPVLPPGRAAGAATPSCATRSLVVWLDTNGDGTAGSTFYKLHFTNLSPDRCTLTGFPGVSAVDLAGRRLGSPAARDTHTRVRTVTLGSGRTATAVLQVADTGVFTAADCGAVTAAGLRVFPPNRTRSKVVPLPFSACSRAGPAYLHVRAVTR